mmetsp:Transcript_81074/g.235141  ORF Transcript_81074/g.235141 Transcript_81074/m.235141 type:complete len:227 (+) Transcript_81074:873-1553(+)
MQVLRGQRALRDEGFSAVVRFSEALIGKTCRCQKELLKRREPRLVRPFSTPLVVVNNEVVVAEREQRMADIVVHLRPREVLPHGVCDLADDVVHGLLGVVDGESVHVVPGVVAGDQHPIVASRRRASGRRFQRRSHEPPGAVAAVLPEGVASASASATALAAAGALVARRRHQGIAVAEAGLADGGVVPWVEVDVGDLQETPRQPAAGGRLDATEVGVELRRSPGD